MNNKVKFIEVSTGKVYYFDENDVSRGPIRIDKPEGFSRLDEDQEKSFSKKEMTYEEFMRLSHEVSEEIEEEGFEDEED